MAAGDEQDESSSNHKRVFYDVTPHPERRAESKRTPRSRISDGAFREDPRRGYLSIVRREETTEGAVGWCSGSASS